MQLDAQISVDHAPSAVVAALSDEDFIRFSTESGGATLKQVTVSTTEQGDVTVVIRRSVGTEIIPPQLRSMVGSDLEIRQVEAWSHPLEGAEGPRYGTVAIEVSGASVGASGHVRLVPTEDGARLFYDLTVRSALPLVGAMVEQKVGRGLRHALDVLQTSLREWLARER